MIELFCFALAVLASPFKSKLRLEAENRVLRHQLIVLRRRRPHGRVQLTNDDRLFFIQLYRWCPAILKVLTIIRPETLVRWHRAGFRCYWRWKSHPRGGRPQIDTELRPMHKPLRPIWLRCATANGSSTANGRSVAPRKCCAISRATPTASPSPTSAWSRSTTTASPSSGRTTASKVPSDTS